MTLTMEHTDKILKTIKELPPLPLVVQKLLKVMEDDNSSADDISHVLNSDQGMTSRVLKLVNSSFYGLSGKVNTVPRAIVILGVAAIRNLALGLGVTKILAKSSSGELQEKFWDHSITTAAACEVLARHTKTAEPEEAFVAGLLHDIGHHVLLVAVPDEYAQVMAEGPMNTIENERRIIGMAHTRAGQKLLKQWKLPANLCDAVRFHHTPEVIMGKDDPLISLVALGDLFAGVHGTVYERSINDANFQKLFKATGLEPSEVSDIMKEIDQRIIETKLFLKVADENNTGTISTVTQEPKTVVMICTDALRAEWTSQVLDHFGHTLLPMKDFFAKASDENVADIIIVDPSSLKAEQLKKIAPILKKHHEKLVIFGEEENQMVLQSFGESFRRIPLAFSRQDLEEELIS